MGDNDMRRALAAGVLSLLALAGGVAPVVGQQSGESPTVTLSSADIRIDGGDTSRIEATYEFSVDSVGSGDAVLEVISGTLWRFDGSDVGDFQASVDGASVSPDVTQSERFVSLGVPVSDVSDGDTVTVTLGYTVSGTGDTLKAPLWTPEFGTTGESRVVTVTTSLPEGTQTQGAVFPTVNERDGTVLRSEMAHVPGLVRVPYGTGTGPLLSLDALSTLAGLGIILGFFGLWGAWQRGYIGSGGEADVA